MIIKRICTELRNQNWSTLGLEILVVIIGIFLGLQADGWYQSQSKKRELYSYYGALSDELANTVWMRKNYVRWHEGVIDGLKKALAALDGVPVTEDEEELIFRALTNIGNPPTSPQRSAVLAAMQAAGMLQLIEDRDLRQALGEIISGIEPEYREYQRYVATIDSPSFSTEIVSYALDPDDNAVIASVDWELARAEPAFRQRVLQGIGLYSHLLRAHRYRTALHEDALEILSERGFQPSGNWLEENQKKFAD